MRTLVLCVAMAGAACAAEDWGFNGRWDIRVPDDARGRAWWLEVEHAPSPAMKGHFVGFPGGDCNEIQHIWIENGELRFTWDSRPNNNAKKGGGGQHMEFRAKVVDGKLEGTREFNKETLRFIGERAPLLADQGDDSSWKKGKPVKLFNGKDLTGWHGSKSKTDLGWTVEDGLLRSKGGAKNLWTDATFWNYELHLEYRVGPHSNSGVGLRGRYEVQILEDYGQPANMHSNGAIYSRIPPVESASKPANEWQTMDVRLIGRYITVVLNGKKIVDHGYIQGLTAIAEDPDEGKPGPLILQGDHGPVDFRNVVLTPLHR